MESNWRAHRCKAILFRKKYQSLGSAVFYTVREERCWVEYEEYLIEIVNYEKPRVRFRAGLAVAERLKQRNEVSPSKLSCRFIFIFIFAFSSLHHRDPLDFVLSDGDCRSFSLTMPGRRNQMQMLGSVMPSSGVPPPAITGSRAHVGSSVSKTLSPPAKPQSSLSRTPKSSQNFTVPISPSIVETKDEAADFGLAEELDYISITAPSSVGHQLVRSDKASRILGVAHRRSMEPIPAAVRTSIVSTRSAREVPSIQSFTPTLPLTSLYVVSGLPKAPHTWTLADPDSVVGLTHADGAVNRWWRAEVLGSTVSPGAGGKKKRKVKGDTEILKGAGALTKQEVAKMLSKALKVNSFNAVNIISHIFS
jgi:hypothetical protein